MAIADIVSYEREFPLAITHPKTGKKIGVTFWVKHIDCAAATRVAKDATVNILSSGDEEKGGEFDQYAACLSKWDWGGQEFEKGKGVLEFTPENARYVLNHESAKWITAQVRNAVVKIGNFTND